MLRGSFDEFSLEDIFWLVDRARNTGRLIVSRPTGAAAFYFREGTLYWAETDLLRESVERHLTRAGTVTKTQLRDAESRMLAGESVAQGLTTFGMVTADELNDSLAQRMGDVAFEMLRRDRGEFTWDAQTAASPDFPCSVSVERLVHLGMERIAELNTIKQDIPSENAVLAISGGASEDASAVTVSAEQWKILSLVNGNNTVADVGQAAELNDLSILRLLHGMVGRGLLEVVSADPGPQVQVAEEPGGTIVLDEPADWGATPDESPAVTAPRSSSPF